LLILFAILRHFAGEKMQIASQFDNKPVLNNVLTNHHGLYPCFVELNSTESLTAC